MKRYTERPFPPYKFIPGHGQHPEKGDGYLKGHKIESEALTKDNFSNHEVYLYGVDLFNHGHYWDAHVYWEVLWNLAGRKGQTADFLKGLIKLAAAGVKFQLNQPQPAHVHLARAEELFLPLPQPFLGIEPLNYLDEIQKDLGELGLDFLYLVSINIPKVGNRESGV